MSGNICFKIISCSTLFRVKSRLAFSIARRAWIKPCNLWLLSATCQAETREANLIADCNLKVRTANERANEIEKRCFRDNDEAAKARNAGEAFRDEHERILIKLTDG